jgi:hypothetical protein
VKANGGATELGSAYIITRCGGCGPSHAWNGDFRRTARNARAACADRCSTSQEAGLNDTIADDKAPVGRWIGGGTDTGPAFDGFLAGARPAASVSPQAFFFGR